MKLAFTSQSRYFILILSIICCTSEILYQLDVSFDNSKLTSKLKVCDKQRPIDAVSDFLIIEGLHNNYVTDPDWIEQIYNKICADTSICNSSSSLDKIASKFLSQHQPSSHVIWNGDTTKPFAFILREGYDSIDTANCICSKVFCTADDNHALTSLIDNEILTRMKQNEEAAQRDEQVQFSSDNHYITLGLIPTSTASDALSRETAMASTDSVLRHAYQALARRFHPDKHHLSSPEQRTRVTETFRKVHFAYETLSDAVLRRQHEESLGWRQIAPVPHQGGMHFSINGMDVHLGGGGGFSYTIVFG
jgi:hypothetical protein